MTTITDENAVWAYSNTGTLAHAMLKTAVDGRLVAACRSNIIRNADARLHVAEDISGRLCKSCETQWNAHLARVERSMQPLQPCESFEVYGAVPEQSAELSATTFAVGDRVRILVRLGGAQDCVLDVPAGTDGVVTELSTTGAYYSVVFDGDPDGIPLDVRAPLLELSPRCTATFTPPRTSEPLPCVLVAHPESPCHESAPVGALDRPWAWRDGAPGSTLPAVRITEARELDEGDVIEYRGRSMTVAYVMSLRCGVEIRMQDGAEILVDRERKFAARRTG